MGAQSVVAGDGLLVEPSVEGAGLPQERVHRRRLGSDALEVCAGEAHLVGDIQAEHDDRPVGAEHDLGGLRVVQDVRLRRR